MAIRVWDISEKMRGEDPRYELDAGEFVEIQVDDGVFFRVELKEGRLTITKKQEDGLGDIKVFPQNQNRIVVD